MCRCQLLINPSCKSRETTFPTPGNNFEALELILTSGMRNDDFYKSGFVEFFFSISVPRSLDLFYGTLQSSRHAYYNGNLGGGSSSVGIFLPM